jgi:hypothetical protein
MKITKEQSFYKWSIDQGDYTRDEEMTITFRKKRLFKKRIKMIAFMILYFSLVATISYFIFAKF